MAVVVMEDRTEWGCIGGRNRGAKISGKLARAPGHVFYRKLNGLLSEHGFDRFVEDRCLPFYEPTGSGRPSIPPGVYFRMLFVGDFKGIESQRGIAWRCEDSLSLREFLGVPLTKATPDHSTLTGIRKRLPQEIRIRPVKYTLVGIRSAWWLLGSGSLLLSRGVVSGFMRTCEKKAPLVE